MDNSVENGLNVLQIDKYRPFPTELPTPENERPLNSLRFTTVSTAQQLLKKYIMIDLY